MIPDLPVRVNLLARLPVEELIAHIDRCTDAGAASPYGKPEDREWCIGRGTGSDPRRWYIGIDFDESHGMGYSALGDPIPPEPGWTVWVEGNDLRAVLAEAIILAEREVWG